MSFRMYGKEQKFNLPPKPTTTKKVEPTENLQAQEWQAIAKDLKAIIDQTNNGDIRTEAENLLRNLSEISDDQKDSTLADFKTQTNDHKMFLLQHMVDPKRLQALVAPKDLQDKFYFQLLQLMNGKQLFILPKNYIYIPENETFYDWCQRQVDHVYRNSLINIQGADQFQGKVYCLVVASLSDEKIWQIDNATKPEKHICIAFEINNNQKINLEDKLLTPYDDHAVAVLEMSNETIFNLFIPAQLTAMHIVSSTEPEYQVGAKFPIVSGRLLFERAEARSADEYELSPMRLRS